MRFSTLQRRVKRCEQVLAVRMADTQDNWGVLAQAWRNGWSPLRIIIAGLAGGFVVGKLEIPGKVNGVRWVQMIGSVSNLVASGQAAFASAMAAHAASTADDAATQADEAADKADAAAGGRPTPAAARGAVAAGSARSAAPPRSARSGNEDGYGPRPAEAATELSER